MKSNSQPEATGMSRREFFAASTAAMAGAWLADDVTGATTHDPGRSGVRGSVKQPNLVIFFPDQLRAESLGCYGHPTVKTPHIDRLAAEGSRFAHCTCHPLCAVSRVSMFTGWPAHVRGHRSFQHLLAPEDPNFFHPPFTGPADFFDMYRPGDVPPLRPTGKGKPPLYDAIRQSRRLGRLPTRICVASMPPTLA
ncbi:MAG: sulfatase-like hydrolase/transferase [Opitutaceae bacterium]